MGIVGLGQLFIGSLEEYEALQEKDPLALYFCRTKAGYIVFLGSYPVLANDTK